MDKLDRFDYTVSNYLNEHCIDYTFNHIQGIVDVFTGLCPDTYAFRITNVPSFDIELCETYDIYIDGELKVFECTSLDVFMIRVDETLRQYNILPQYVLK